MRTKKKLATPARKKRWVPPSADSIILSENFEKVQLPILGAAAFEMYEDMYKKVRQNTDDSVTEAVFDIKMYRDRALEGDQAAADELHKIAVDAVQALNWVADEKPELLRSLARNRTIWPVLFSHSPIVQASLNKRLLSIDFATELGTDWIHALEVIKDPATATSDGVKGWALLLINAIQGVRIAHATAIEGVNDQMPLFQNILGVTDAFRYELYDFNLRRALGFFHAKGIHILPQYTFDLLKGCARLPDFSSEQSVVDMWWDVGLELLMLNTNGHPENIPALMKLGRSRAKHYSGLKSDPNPRAGLKSLLESTSAVDQYRPKSAISNIRAKIRTDLKEEFERLANQMAKASAKGEPPR